jgi:hypothetical protein
MTSHAPGVTVGGLLQTRPQLAGVDDIDESEIGDVPDSGEEP